MKKENKNNDLIVEDVLYFDTYQTEDGKVKYISNAENTFFYQFLMENAENSIGGELNRKAAEDFRIYQEIYVYLMNRGLLKDKRYCIDCCEVENHFFFTLNLSKLKKCTDLEEQLLEYFCKENFSEHIHTFCNPVDSLRCDFCGAISFSRHIGFAVGNKLKTFCLSCHPLDKPGLRDEIQKVYKKQGVLPAVNKRIELLKELSKFRIPEGKTIDNLLDEYQYELDDSEINDTDAKGINIVNDVLKRNGEENLFAFQSVDFDIVIWNRLALRNIDIFSQCAALSEDGEIITLFNKPNVVYLNNTAIDYILQYDLTDEEKEFINLWI